jgi:hypothetical protein
MLSASSPDLNAGLDQLSTLQTALVQLPPSATSLVDQFRSRAQQSLPAMLYNWKAFSSIPPELSQLTIQTADEIVKSATNGIFTQCKAVQQVEVAITAISTQGSAGVGAAITAISDAITGVHSVQTQVETLSSNLSNTCAVLSQTLTNAIQAAGTIPITFGTPPVTVTIQMFGAATALADAITTAVGNIAAPITVNDAEAAITPIYQNWSNALTQLQLPNLANLLAGKAVTMASQLTSELQQTASQLSAGITQTLGQVGGSIDALEQAALASIDAAAQDLGQGIVSFQNFLGQLSTSLPPGLDDLQRQLQAGYSQLSGSPTFQDPDTTLRLLRAAGAAPTQSLVQQEPVGVFLR